MDGAVRGAARDPGVSRARGRPVRSAASLPVRHRGGRRALDERGEWVVNVAGESHRGRFLLCATGCLSAVNRPDIPGLTISRGRCTTPRRGPRGSGPARQEDRRDRHGVVGHPGGADPGRGGGVAGGVSAVAQLHGADAQSPVVAGGSAAHSGGVSERGAFGVRAAGTPHGTYHKNALDTDPEEREEALWRRWRDGGVLFGKTFPDQTSVLAANDIARQFAEDRIREIVADPAVAEDLIPVDHPIGTSESAPTRAITRRSTATTCDW